MEKKEILDNQKSDPRPVGRWIIYIDKCTGCGECVDACSLDLLYIENEKVKMTEESQRNALGNAYPPFPAYC